MKQIDVLLRQRPLEYVVPITVSKSYDLVLPEKLHRVDLVIDGLLDRQGIYGDELEPLIFHLTENEIALLLNLNLLADTFLYSFDGKLLGDMDGYTLKTLGDASSNNIFNLKQSVVSIFNELSLGMNSVSIQLLTQAAATLAETLAPQTAELSLSTNAGVTSVPILSPKAYHTALLTNVYENLVNTVFLGFLERGIHWLDNLLSEYDPMTLGEIEQYTPKMSLVSGEGKAYLRFALPLTGSAMSLSSSTQSILETVALRSGRNSLVLSENTASITNDTAVTPRQSIIHLTAPEQEATITPYAQPGSSYIELFINLDQPPTLSSMFYGNNTMPLRDEMTEDMDLDHGMEVFDGNFLSYWDSWLLEEMEEAAKIA